MANNNYASLLFEMKQYKDAQWIAAKTLDGFREVSGKEHILSLAAQSTLGEALMAEGNYDEAHPILKELTRLAEHALVENHDYLVIFRGLYGECLVGLGRNDEAKHILLRVFGELNENDVKYRKRFLIAIIKMYGDDENQKALWQQKWEQVHGKSNEK